MQDIFVCSMYFFVLTIFERIQKPLDNNKKVMSILFRTFDQKIRGCRRYPLSSEPRDLLGHLPCSHCRLRQLDVDGGSRGGYNE